MNMRFTELGAIRFERDVRSIANYLTTQTTFGGVRDKFTRLQQIATVLNMDEVGLSDVLAGKSLLTTRTTIPRTSTPTPVSHGGSPKANSMPWSNKGCKSFE